MGLGPEKVRREIQLQARLDHVNIVELKQVRVFVADAVADAVAAANARRCCRCGGCGGCWQLRLRQLLFVQVAAADAVM